LRLGLFFPELCVVGGTEGYYYNFGIQGFYIRSVLAQLRHVLAAGQSAQMAHEDQQRMLRRMPLIFQQGFLTAKVFKHNVWGLVARS